MNKKTNVISVLIVIGIICVLGFLNVKFEIGAPDKEYYTLVDSEKKVVVLEEKPKKVAVLFSSLADIWTLAGGEVAITVGESVERGICTEDVLLVDSGAGKTVDNEALISYEPDFVLLSADIAAQKETAELLRKSGIAVAELRLDSFEDYLDILRMSAGINGNEEAYKTYGEKQKEEIDSLISKAEKENTGTDILFIRSGSGSSSAKAKKGEDNFAAKMLEDLGCRNIADNAPVLLDGLSIEEILSENPEHIFISLMGDEKAAKAYMNQVLSDEAWQNLRAVKEGNVHFLPKELFQYKPCSKWSEAYEYLYEILGGNIE